MDWITRTYFPLQISAKELYINKSSPGNISLDGTFDNVYIYDSPASATGVTLAGTVKNLYLFGTSGVVKIANGTILDDVFIMPVPGRSVHLVYGSGVDHSGFFTLLDYSLSLRAYGDGFLDAASGVGELHLGERFFCQFTGDSEFQDVSLYDRLAVINHQGSGKIGGRLTVYDGRFTLNENSNATVTLNGLTVYDDGIADLRNGKGSATLTSPATQWGGVILVDDGVVMTPG